MAWSQLKETLFGADNYDNDATFLVRREDGGASLAPELLLADEQSRDAAGLSLRGIAGAIYSAADSRTA
jgi:hypothetical protein